MHVILRSLVAVLSIAAMAALGSQSVAQTAPAEKAGMETAMTAAWLTGHWSAALAEISTDISDTTVRTHSQEYWIDADVSALPNGKLEAVLTARQMGDETEFVTWKADVTISNGTATFKPASIVGKKEWWLYSPQTMQLKRRDNKLVGRAFSELWGMEFDSSLITLER